LSMLSACMCRAGALRAAGGQTDAARRQCQPAPRLLRELHADARAQATGQLARETAGQRLAADAGVAEAPEVVLEALGLQRARRGVADAQAVEVRLVRDGQ